MGMASKKAYNAWNSISKLHVGYGAGARPIGSFPTEGACTGWVTGIENVRDLSGAEEMSE